MNLTIAFSTSDGKNLANTHFGDATLFPVYEVSEDKITFIKMIENSTEKDEEKIHGDPKKAKNITQIFKPLGVQIICAKQFGKNILRMSKNFVPVLVGVNTVEEALIKIKQNLNKIEIQWNKGENRKHLKI